jgi:hypothetical protein
MPLLAVGLFMHMAFVNILSPEGAPRERGARGPGTAVRGHLALVLKSSALRAAAGLNLASEKKEFRHCVR